MTDRALRTVQNWHTALNAREIDQVLALVHPDVEIGGPRGQVRGSEAMSAWVDRANARFHPSRWYKHDNTVVVEEQGEWLDAESGAVIGQQTVAIVFVVEDNLITQIMRYETLESALATAGLNESHQIRPHE